MSSAGRMSPPLPGLWLSCTRQPGRAGKGKWVCAALTRAVLNQCYTAGNWWELVLAGEQGAPAALGSSLPSFSSGRSASGPSGPATPRHRLAVTDRLLPPLLIGSAVANGTAVARQERAARASPHRAALRPLTGERGLTGARLV